MKTLISLAWMCLATVVIYGAGTEKYSTTLLGLADKHSIQLKWDDANIDDVLQTEIQKSVEGAEFITIGTNEGGQSFRDLQPGNGNNTYRLVLHDKDGKTWYSPATSVLYGNVRAVAIYPNPAAKSVNMDFYQENAGNFSLEIIDATGQSVMLQEISAQNGINSIPLNTSELKPGYYFVRGLNERKEVQFTQKLSVL